LTRRQQRKRFIKLKEKKDKRSKSWRDIKIETKRNRERHKGKNRVTEAERD
jgi:hypothetical protein